MTLARDVSLKSLKSKFLTADKETLSPVQPNSRRWGFYAWVYTRVICLLLGVAAIGKLVGVLSEDGLLSKKDPVFLFLTLRQSWFFAAIIELYVIQILLRESRVANQMCALLGLSGAFILYRIGKEITAPTEPCSCWGALSKVLVQHVELLELMSLCLTLSMLVVPVVFFCKLDFFRRGDYEDAGA